MRSGRRRNKRRKSSPTVGEGRWGSSDVWIRKAAESPPATNAIQLKDVLGEPIKEDFMPELVKRYPQLKKIVAVASKGDVLVPAQNG